MPRQMASLNPPVPAPVGGRLGRQAQRGAPGGRRRRHQGGRRGRQTNCRVPGCHGHCSRRRSGHEAADGLPLELREAIVRTPTIERAPHSMLYPHSLYPHRALSFVYHLPLFHCLANVFSSEGQGRCRGAPRGRTVSILSQLLASPLGRRRRQLSSRSCGARVVMLAERPEPVPGLRAGVKGERRKGVTRGAGSASAPHLTPPPAPTRAS